MVRVLTALVNQGPTGDVASAIFFAVDSLDARISIVEKAFSTLFRRFRGLDNINELNDRWEALVKATRGLKKTRNAVAHGQMTTVMIRSRKRHVRLTTPIAEQNQMRSAIEKHQLPGMSSNDINTSAAAARVLIAEYNIFADISGLAALNFSAFLASLPQKLLELEALRPQSP